MFVNNWKLGSTGTVIADESPMEPGKVYVKIDEYGLINPQILFPLEFPVLSPRKFYCKEDMIEKEDKLWYLTNPKAFESINYLCIGHGGSGGGIDYASVNKSLKFFPRFTQITKKSTMNSLVSKVADLFITEPQKTFRKLGITDDRNNLTEQGEMVFINWLFTQNQDAFNTAIATPLLAEQNAKK